MLCLKQYINLHELSLIIKLCRINICLPKYEIHVKLALCSNYCIYMIMFDKGCVYLKELLCSLMTYIIRNIFYILFAILILLLIYPAILIIQSNYTINEKLQSITNLFAIISVVFVGYQAYAYIKDYKTKNQKEEVGKAINLAEIYANEIIHKISYLYYVYKDLGISDIITKIGNNKISEFDIMELDDLITKKDQREIYKKLINIDSSILIKRRAILVNDDSRNIIDRAMMMSVPSVEQISKIDLSVILNHEFQCVKEEVLNKLEWFCMYFNSNIANSEMVYQSLHQTFLKNVKILYFDIASINNSGKDKYYTNIITLYNEWNNMYMLANDQELKVKRAQVHRGIKIST